MKETEWKPVERNKTHVKHVEFQCLVVYGFLHSHCIHLLHLFICFLPNVETSESWLHRTEVHEPISLTPVQRVFLCIPQASVVDWLCADTLYCWQESWPA